MPDFDIVSDLNGNDTVSANTGNVEVNRVDPVREPVEQAQKVDKQEAPKGDKPLSLRDQISSALKGEDETPPAAQQGDTRPRNPDGTFAPAPVPADPAAQAPIGTQQPAAVPVPMGVDPTVFNALPAETQVQLARTMEDLNSRQAQLAGHEQIEQIIAPRRQAWALNGMTEAQAVNQLFALSDFASTDPKGFINYFAQQSGIDLEDIVFGSDPGDPEVNALKQQVQQLESQLTGFNTQQQQAAHENTVNEIISFFDQKGEDGNALRPYALELGDSILPFIQAVKQQNPSLSKTQVLQEAYDRACWGTPSVRAKMQQAANMAADAERLRQQQDKTQRARVAGSSVAPGVPTTPAPSPADGSMSLRDTIRASIANAS